MGALQNNLWTPASKACSLPRARLRFAAHASRCGAVLISGSFYVDGWGCTQSHSVFIWGAVGVVTGYRRSRLVFFFPSLKSRIAAKAPPLCKQYSATHSVPQHHSTRSAYAASLSTWPCLLTSGMLPYASKTLPHVPDCTVQHLPPQPWL